MNIDTYSLILCGRLSDVERARIEAVKDGYRTHFEPRYIDPEDGTVYGDLYAATPEWVERYKSAGGLWY